MSFENHYDTLAIMGIEFISMKVEGFGDSGDVEIEHCVLTSDSPLNAMVTENKDATMVVFEALDALMVNEVHQISLLKVLLDNAWSAANSSCPGFDQNSGGGGKVDVYPIKREVEVAVDYYDEVEYEDDEDNDENNDNEGQDDEPKEGDGVAKRDNYGI